MVHNDIVDAILSGKNHRIFCIYGEHIQETKLLDDIHEYLKRLSNPPGRSFEKITILGSRAHYIERHQHQGLFFQQRYQSSYNEWGETVQHRLRARGVTIDDLEWDQWKKWFELEEIWEKPLLQLSSGEWQRFSLCYGLINRPEILIVPDLLNGLDQEWQHKIFDRIVGPIHYTGLLIFSSDVPAKHPAVQNISMGSSGGIPSTAIPEFPTSLFDAYHEYQSKFLSASTGPVQIRMEGVNITYGEVQILKEIHWHVQKGNKWNIQGPNGAGKSSLVSLINADNPQGYSQPIQLFGQKYGRQSIWEKKARIAYFGSDFFQYFRSSKTLEDVVHQQLKTPYLKTIQPSMFLIDGFLTHFGLAPYRRTPYSRISKTHRRQLLLLLSYLKSSEILLLDEPYQDLSHHQIKLNNHFLETVQPSSSQTVIFVTHRADHKPNFLNKVLKLKEGRILNTI
ncbi:ATP-binding cassette domain-containing protein [Membranicola marinus]|uniref:ATP-binding cassette domain-containing protein n=1 Tax=Membranihabitans marinus TaxID=1227546 RepID=A0A953L8U1_9BACT|nr:ATP-binding cassette domain-containing protein [Membranihabitans marinus]MBY5958095.1 ATP-binding cassette domain-containing protein [Membranihabitans marinus]